MVFMVIMMFAVKPRASPGLAINPGSAGSCEKRLSPSHNPEGLADGVRRELSQPITAARKDQLRQSVAQALRRVDDILVNHATQIHALPGPTRRAYEFLKNLNFAAIVPAPAIDAEDAVPGSIRFPRLQRDLEHQLDRLATVSDVHAWEASRERLLEATACEEYRAIHAELEVLGGIEEHVEGIHHDLAESFDRVNRSCFGGSMPRPRLTWSRTFSGRKFGHYDPIRDAVMISSTLDRDDVPGFVIDSVMHHELLHKQLGVDWRNGRMAVHTPEFRRRERQFEQFAEAEAQLKRLADASMTGCP